MVALSADTESGVLPAGAALGGARIDSLAARVRASTPACAPSSEIVLFTDTASLYVPAATWTVPPVVTVSIRVLDGEERLSGRDAGAGIAPGVRHVTDRRADRLEVVDHGVGRDTDGEVVDVAVEEAARADVRAHTELDPRGGICGLNLAPRSVATGSLEYAVEHRPGKSPGGSVVVEYQVPSAGSSPFHVCHEPLTTEEYVGMNTKVVKWEPAPPGFGSTSMLIVGPPA